MSSIIEVNNLSKSFVLAHEQGGKQYTALRDVMAQKAKKIFSFPAWLKPAPKMSSETFWALKDVSFNIEQGDRVGIIGRNGAGKSTLLKILSRITEPTAGQIKIKGRVASLLEVGTGFHPELTGRENIYLNGAILGMGRTEIKSKFDEIVAFAEVERFLDTPVKKYSSGMYVRLAFAVAAHLEPEILIVDEVLAVGDAQFQKKCLGKMEDVSKGHGRTVLFVSHNMGVIAQLCNTGIFFSKGQLLEQGNTRNIIDKYLTQENVQISYVAPESKKLGEVYFTKIDVRNEKNEISESFQFDENIYVNISIQIREYNPTLKLSVTLQNNNGDYLTTIMEDLKDLTGAENSKESTFKIKLAPKVIAPNSYAFRLALFEPRGKVYDLVEMICPIKVYDSGTKLSLFEGTNYGNFFIDYTILK